MTRCLRFVPIMLTQNLNAFHTPHCAFRLTEIGHRPTVQLGSRSLASGSRVTATLCNWASGFEQPQHFARRSHLLRAVHTMDASSPASSSSPGVTFPAMPISAAASTTAQSEGPRTFELVVAACEETKEGQGIGKDGRLPWSLKGDMAFFRKITSSTENSSRMNAVIMGRKTWESLPPRFQPLPNRINIVLSRNGAPTASTPASAEGVVPPTASSSSGPTNSPISGPTNSPASGPTNSPARGSTSSYIKSPISGSTNTRAGTLVSTNSASGPASSAPADAAASSSPAPAASSTRALFSDISNHTDEDSQQHKPSQLLKAQAQQQQQQQHEQQPLSQLTLPDQLQPEAPQPVQQQQQRQQQQQQVYWCNSLEAAMQLLQAPELAGRVERAFVIGGGEVYRAALETPMCAGVFLTSVKAAVQCDTFFPTLNAGAWRLRTASMPQSDAPKALPAAAVSTGHAAPAAAAAGNDFQYTFLHFVRNEESSPPASSSRHQEHQYLDLIRSVLENGVYRGDRTGTGTYSHFGATMRFDLRTSFPLLTTKRVFWRGVAEELLWFVSGDTSAKTLQDKKIKIWDGNSSREYLNKIGLVDREEGDLGPVYGFQWRHFGANYSDMHADYSGQGVDQLADIIRRLKSTETRNDRRLILSAWNPAALHLMALPPCHMMCQFYVANDELSCMMYQRSCDLGLGVPFNIASYALLTCLVAQVCGLKRGEFIHVLGDAHVYVNHAEPLLQQLQNEPRPFPVLHINPEKTDIDSFTMDDLTLEGYNPHASLAMKMAV